MLKLMVTIGRGNFFSHAYPIARILEVNVFSGEQVRKWYNLPTGLIRGVTRLGV